MPVHKWIWPLVLVSILVFVLSLRQLSDPDLGFHLKYGKWIVANQRVPLTDVSTYSVTDHTYTDLHWFFQVILFEVFKLTGYPGISLFVCLLSLLLFLVLLLRQRFFNIPASVITMLLFAAFLIIDPRIAPRPEMFTFLFLTTMLLILDLYMERIKKMLYLLPVIMILWCNIHALFILGLIVVMAYFTGILLSERKFDKSLFFWMVLSCLVCFINPYGIKVFALPLELLTRFDPDNVYNQHIQEFQSFFAQSHFVIRDYLFMLLAGITVIGTFFTFHHRKPHEFILLLLFGFLAINSIRNIPLFVLVALPITGKQAFELSSKITRWRKETGLVFFLSMIILPLALIPRLLTNAYYINNNSFNKTGIGLDRTHQPVQAASFLLNNHLDGRILNSIGFGGWLSWSLPQPVFIDGRLEVMQEPVYKEITQSWNGGLPGLINKYQPQLIIYNYLKYYPWTFQLKEMRGWRLIYIDGVAAIFASNTYAKEIPEISLPVALSTDNPKVPKKLNEWLNGFYMQTDYSAIDRLHQTLFSHQMNRNNQDKTNIERSVFYFNEANYKSSHGDIKGALGDYCAAIKLQPSYSKAYNNRGILRASAFSDYSGAILDFDSALSIDPDYGDAYLGRGTVHFLLRDIQSAYSDWNRARMLGSEKAARLIKLHCNR